MRSRATFVPIRPSTGTAFLLNGSLVVAGMTGGFVGMLAARALVLLVADGVDAVPSLLRSPAAGAESAAPRWILDPATLIGLAVGLGIGVILWRRLAWAFFPRFRPYIERT